MDSQTTTTPQTATERASTVGHQTTSAASDVAGTAGQEAAQVAREAKDQVRRLWGQTRSDLTEQASTQQTRVAGGLRELSDQLRQMAGAADSDGMARGLVDDVARRAGDAAGWLDQRDPGSLLDEARSFARQRPGTFLAIAAGVGVLAGRLSRGLVDEARDSGDTGSGAGNTASDRFGGSYGTGGHDTPAGGYGTATGSNGDAGVPTATSPTASTTTSTPVTPGAASGTGSSTVPSGELPDAHRQTQPIAPDGTPSPIDREGHLTAEGETSLRGDR